MRMNRQQPHITRRRLLNQGSALAGLALAGVLPQAAAARTTPTYADWFGIDKALKNDWQVRGVANDPWRVAIAPRQRVSEAAQHVVVFYPRQSSAYDIAISKILSVFAEKNLDTRFTVINFRRDDAHGYQALAAAERERADIIYAMGSESTAWLWEHYRGGGKPVVSVCAKDPVILGQAQDYHSGTGGNFAFTSLNMPVEAQLAYVLELRPKLKNLAVLVDANNISAVQTQAEPIAQQARARGIRVLQVAIHQTENVAEAIGRQVHEAVIAMRKNDVNLEQSLFWITGSTAVFREIATINANADRVPVLSVVPEVVREGSDSAVMSIGISFESNAHLAAIYGARVLGNETAVGDLPVGVVSPPDIAINFRKARDIGLRVPFSFFEGASFIYDYDGRPVRHRGKPVN